MKQIDGENHDERFEGMPKAGLDGNEIIRNRKKDKCPGKETGGGSSAAKRESEAEQSGDRRQAVVDLADNVEEPVLVSWVRHARPEEVEPLKCKGGELARVRADPGSRELASLSDEGELAKLDVEAVLWVVFGEIDEHSVAKAESAGAIACVQFGSKV